MGDKKKTETADVSSLKRAYEFSAKLGLDSDATWVVGRGGLLSARWEGRRICVIVMVPSVIPPKVLESDDVTVPTWAVRSIATFRNLPSLEQMPEHGVEIVTDDEEIWNYVYQIRGTEFTKTALRQAVANLLEVLTRVDRAWHVRAQKRRYTSSDDESYSDTSHPKKKACHPMQPATIDGVVYFDPNGCWMLSSDNMDRCIENSVYWAWTRESEPELRSSTGFTLRTKERVENLMQLKDNFDGTLRRDMVYTVQAEFIK